MNFLPITNKMDSLKTNIFVFQKLLLLTFLFGFTCTYAQERKQDVVYLKNGTIVRGQIIEHKFAEYVKIESYGQNVWVFETSEIDKIAKENEIVLKQKIAFPKKGFYNITDVGILVGSGSNNLGRALSFSALITNGYKFENRISLGAITGVEVMRIAMAPVLAEFRFDFTTGKTSPFVSLRGGYSLPLTNFENAANNPTYQGGYSAGAVIGIRNYLTHNTALLFSLGFRQTELISHSSVWWWEGGRRNVKTVELFNRVEIRLGLLFN